MTPQQIVGVAVRLFAIWLVFEALTMLAGSATLERQPGIGPTWGFNAWAAIMFLLAAILWFFPMTVAHTLIPRTRYDNVLSVPSGEATTIACVILGLWLFTVRVLPGLAYYISLVIVVRANGESFAASEEFIGIRLGAIAIQFVGAALLCFKARAIARYLTVERTPEREE